MNLPCLLSNPVYTVYPIPPLLSTPNLLITVYNPLMKPAVFSEGSLIDDGGFLISSYYVDFRTHKDRVPITTVIKGSERKFALECCSTIRISKPDRFRNFGEGLIRDPSEMSFSHTEVDSVTVDDPHDLAEARMLSAEKNRAAEIIQSKFTGTTKSIKKTQKRSRSIVSGKNGWIFCTSIEPACQEEMSNWWITLPKNYDHISYIRRPREFAKALGLMVAEQCGPQGKENYLKGTFGDLEESQTYHRCQTVFHGPVVYLDDPYKVISEEMSEVGRMLLPVFVKRLEYEDQNEYRFAIWAEEEPAEECKDLKISLAMLGSLQERVDKFAWQNLATDTPTADSSNYHSARIENDNDGLGEREQEDSNSSSQLLPSPIDFLRDPSFPIAPHTYTEEDLPNDLYEKTTTYSTLIALRRAVEKCSVRRRTEAASSAWHIEPCIRRLCARFDDPIKTISISEDNYVVVAIKFPKESVSKARIAIGPLGSGMYEIEYEGGKRGSRSENGWQLGESFLKVFEEAGLRVRDKLPGSTSWNLNE